MNNETILNHVYDTLIKELEFSQKWDLNYDINSPNPMININDIIVYYNTCVYYIDTGGTLNQMNLDIDKIIDIPNGNIYSFVEEKDAFYYIGGDQSKKVNVSILYDGITKSGIFREVLYSSSSTFAEKRVPINDFDKYFSYNYTVDNLKIIDEL